MKFFKDTTDQVFAFDAGAQVPAGLIEITKAEAAQLSAPPAPSAEQVAAIVTAARQAAYVSEADPLFFKWQRGEATKDVWLEKVAEIKARFPDGVMPS